MTERKHFGCWNEWGRLREAALGRVDDLAEPGYIPELVWVTEEGKEKLRANPGQLTRTAYPKEAASIAHSIDCLEKILTDHGVIVHRTPPIPEGFDEERDFLNDVQPGNYTIGGAGFFRVIGNRVIVFNSFHYPFRRKHVWSVRRMLEPLLENSNASYIVTPPPSPHSTKDDLYIENGDIMMDGHNVYVGMSGNASNMKGVAWLGQLLGDDYRVHPFRLKPTMFHTDWVLSLNRPGLLAYCPEALVDPLPEPLAKWDKIEVRLEEAAGANNLSLDEKTVVVAEQYGRVAEEYSKRGFEVLTIPAEVSIEYGSGPRCLTGVLSRDP